MIDQIDKNIYNSLDFLPEGYFIVNKEFKVLYWNKSLEVLTNVSKGEIINQKLDAIFPNFGLPVYQKRIEPIFTGGPPVIFSGKLHKKLFTKKENEEGHFFRITISTLPLDGGISNALFSIEDRTEIYSQIDELFSIKEKAINEIHEKERIHKKLLNQHKEIEEAFATLSVKNQEIEIQKQRLQELNATKDKFFSILAHDLISPFNALLGLSEIMIKHVKAHSNPELNLYIELQNQTLKQTFSLLENLLEWSRTQTGGIKYTPKTIALKQIVADNVELHNLKFSEKRIEPEILIDNSILVYVDPNMLSTILRNLISNTIKFTPTNGKVQISASEFSGNTENPNKLVKIAISDTGTGISKENQQRLFRIEENFTTYGTNNEKGTGLGLILCKDFVEINGGKIWVESDPNSKMDGKGTTFFFTIPRV
jgi:signal transduction histidine kinase